MNTINKNIQMKVKIFKCAVAFFFLFFLHGTSIGTRQQGISYNGQGFVSVQEFEKLMFSP